MKHKTDNASKSLAAQIIAKWGAAGIQAARKRLCVTCGHGSGGYCNESVDLLPLTSEGKDCPYHRPVQILVGPPPGPDRRPQVEGP